MREIILPRFVTAITYHPEHASDLLKRFIAMYPYLRADLRLLYRRLMNVNSATILNRFRGCTLLPTA